VLAFGFPEKEGSPVRYRVSWSGIIGATWPVDEAAEGSWHLYQMINEHPAMFSRVELNFISWEGVTYCVAALNGHLEEVIDDCPNRQAAVVSFLAGHDGVLPSQLDPVSIKVVEITDGEEGEAGDPGTGNGISSSLEEEFRVKWTPQEAPVDWARLTRAGKEGLEEPAAPKSPTPAEMLARERLKLASTEERTRMLARAAGRAGTGGRT
jgi:hypothetical protein